MDPEQLGDIINACLAQGFELPLYLAGVSCNGAAIVVSYEEAADDATMIDATVLAEHVPYPGLLFPLHILITDATGHATRLILRALGQWDFAERAH